MSDDTFLSRWSQRKREVARAERPTASPAPEPEEEAFDLSLLPALEDITAESDLSLFLRKGVPAALRNAAMKKIWSLDPAIRDRVGDALDYAWDWNVPGGVPGGGELPADFDAQSMVARIFGDEPADENVIEAAAPQQSKDAEGMQEHASVPEIASFTEKERDSAQEDRQEPPSVDAGGSAAAPKPRRHGSALPS